MSSNADLVFQSYGRACSKPEFFECFYTIFMGKSDEIRAMFVNSKMETQRGLLRGGIMWLIMHARGMPDTKSRALGESHSKKNMDIHPMHYNDWLDALVETLEKFDPEYTLELGQTWRATLLPGIQMIQNMYHD
jgi:hemoglobin-like flavoprotein